MPVDAPVTQPVNAARLFQLMWGLDIKLAKEKCGERAEQVRDDQTLQRVDLTHTGHQHEQRHKRHAPGIINVNSIA